MPATRMRDLATCACWAHPVINAGVPRSVPNAVPCKSGGSQRQPTCVPENRPEIDDLRPVLRSRATLANRRLQPLGHLTARLQVYVTSTLMRNCSMAKGRRRITFKPSPLPISATTRVGCMLRAHLILGTADWAQFRAHWVSLLLGLFNKRKEIEARRRFL